MNVAAIQELLRRFASERDWDQFHSPKNITMALSAEVGELAEVFQWLTEEQSRALASDHKKKAKAEEEIADVAIYLIRLCDKLNVDLEDVVRAKIEKNGAKYPVALAKGNASKYTEFTK